MGFYRSITVATLQPCKFEYAQAANYFTSTQPYGLIVDANFRIFFDDNTNLNWKRVKCEGTCGGWYGIQSLLPPGTASTCMSLVDNPHEGDEFFEVFSGLSYDQGIWRQKKDGSERVQIYNSGPTGQNPAGASWDNTVEKVVWTIDSGAPIGRVYRCNRTGGGVEYWDIYAILGFQARGVGVFDDGRYVLWNMGTSQIQVYSGWGGSLVQSYSPATPPGTPIWFSMDNVNNRVYFSNNSYVAVYNVPSNTVLGYYNWGTSFTQATYFPYDGYAYARQTSGVMKRWSYTKGVGETWTGAYYKRYE